VIVPSMSETTTESSYSQTNIRAVHAVAPVNERENVIVFAPGFRSKDFCILSSGHLTHESLSEALYQLVGCQS
jgi:hypothetical protein